MALERTIGLKIRINRNICLNQVVKRGDSYCVGKRKVEPGIFSEAIACEFDTFPDDEIMPRTIVKKAITGIVRKHPCIAKIANGFKYDVRMGEMKEGNTLNNDWIYEGNKYNVWVQFCKYIFIE